MTTDGKIYKNVFVLTLNLVGFLVCMTSVETLGDQHNKSLITLIWPLFHKVFM